MPLKRILIFSHQRNSASHASKWRVKWINQSMEWVNKWNNQTILSNAIRSCNNAIQDFQSITQRCSRFQIVKQKEENCFHMLTLARMKSLNILVTKIWLRSVFENWQNYLVKIADFWSNIIKEKKWKPLSFILCNEKPLWYAIFKVHWKKAVESSAKIRVLVAKWVLL